MSRFDDDNTLGEILGCVLLAESWGPRVDFEIDPLLTEIADRIREKLARNKNPTRHNWFTTALGFIEKAIECYRQKDYQNGGAFLRKAEDHLESGNKAHRRATNFVVGPDGSIKNA